MYDIVIIGAGTAGMTAAIYGLRAGKKVLVLDRVSYGGQIINSPIVENYPGISKISGFDFATNIYKQVKELGSEIKYEEVIKITPNSVKTIKDEYEAKTIIIASGLKRRTLGLYGEKDFEGRGISYCATCDGNFYRKKNVAIVGGGNSALEEALYLSNICDEVNIIHRKNSFSADESLQNELTAANNVKSHMNSTVVSLYGEDTLTGIKVQDNESRNDKELDVSGLFISIGHTPECDFADIIEKDSQGYIISNEDCQTNISNIFVAGDCRVKKLRQLTTAVSDGAIAATNAINYINSKMT